MKQRVLFLCTHNSARSQMDEAFLNSICGHLYEARSAGTEPTVVNPMVVTAMKEIGYDLSRNRAKSTDEFLEEKFDLVVTLCAPAQESCPFFPGAVKYEHHDFDDPAGCQGTERRVLACVRRIRNEIREWVGVRFKA